MGHTKTTWSVPIKENHVISPVPVYFLWCGDGGGEKWSEIWESRTELLIDRSINQLTNRLKQIQLHFDKTPDSVSIARPNVFLLHQQIPSPNILDTRSWFNFFNTFFIVHVYMCTCEWTYVPLTGIWCSMIVSKLEHSLVWWVHFPRSAFPVVVMVVRRF